MDPFVARKFKQYAIATLDNLSSDIDAAEIDNGVRIVERSNLADHVHPPIDFINDTLQKLNNPDSEFVLEHFGLSKQEERPRFPTFVPLATHFLEYHSDCENIDISASDTYVNRLLTLFSTVITSLRLREATPIYISYFHANPLSLTSISPSEDMPVLYPIVVTQFITTTHPRQSQQYRLLNRHLPELRRIFRSVKSSSGPVRIALNRLDQQYLSKTNEDRLLDIMIGLEALYGDNQPQLQYRLALRCSRHLGGSGQPHERIFDHIECAYDIRSKIVHGGSDSLEDKNCRKVRQRQWKSDQDMLQDIAALLRDGLHSFLLDTRYPSTKQGHNDFLDALNNCIKSGKEFTPNPA